MVREEFKHLPHRPNISLIVYRNKEDSTKDINSNKKEFLIMTRINWPDNYYKFPQGGVENNEDILSAAKREFIEEMGNDKIIIKGISKYTNTYDWEDELISQRKKYRGQKQNFAVIEFIGEENDIKPDPAEVKKYKWASKQEIISYSQKKEHALFHQYNGVIEKVIEEFLL